MTKIVARGSDQDDALDQDDRIVGIGFFELQIFLHASDPGMARTREFEYKRMTIVDLHFKNCSCSDCKPVGPDGAPLSPMCAQLLWPRPLTTRDLARSRFFSLDPEYDAEFTKWLEEWHARSRLGGHREPYSINVDLLKNVSEIVAARNISFPRDLAHREVNSRSSQLSALHDAVDGNLLMLFRAHVNDTYERQKGLLFRGFKVTLPEVLELLRVDDHIFAQIENHVDMMDLMYPDWYR
jgi:hypothetical protein